MSPEQDLHNTEQWDSQLAIRHTRIINHFLTFFNRAEKDPNLDRKFLYAKMHQLLALSAKKFADLIDGESVILAKIPSTRLFSYDDGNGNNLRHTKNTLASADLIMQTLIGFETAHITQNPRILINQARADEKAGKTSIHAGRGIQVDFTTTIPGISLSLVLASTESMPRRILIRPLSKAR